MWVVTSPNVNLSLCSASAVGGLAEIFQVTVNLAQT